MNVANLIINLSRRKFISKKPVLEEVKKKYFDSDSNLKLIRESWRLNAPSKLLNYFDEDKLIGASDPQNIKYYLFLKSSLELNNEINVSVVILWDNEDIEYSINTVIRHIKSNLKIGIKFSILETEKLSIIPYDKTTQDIWSLKHALIANIRQSKPNGKSIKLLIGQSMLCFVSTALWQTQFFHSKLFFNFSTQYLANLDSFLIGVSGSIFVSLGIEIIKEWNTILAFLKIKKSKQLEISLENLSDVLRPIQKNSLDKLASPFLEQTMKLKAKSSESTVSENDESETLNYSSSDEIVIQDKKEFKKESLEKIIELVSKHEFVKADELFEEIILSKYESQEDKIEQKLFFLHTKYIYGDTKTLDSAEIIINENPSPSYIHFLANQLIADCKVYSKQFNSAIPYYLKVIGCEFHKLNLQAHIGLFQCYCNLQEYVKLKNLVIGSLNTQNNEIKSVILTLFADYFDQKGREILKAILYEKSLEYNTNNLNNLFSSAYNYSNADKAGFDFGKYLTLFYYDLYMRFRNDNDSVLNNLGVIYGELELVFHQKSMYKASYLKGNSLALKNYISSLKENGYQSLIIDILNENPDIAQDEKRGVINVKHEINSIISEEEKQKEKALRFAEQAKKQLHTITNNMFIERVFEGNDFLNQINWTLKGISNTNQKEMNLTNTIDNSLINCDKHIVLENKDEKVKYEIDVFNKLSLKEKCFRTYL